MRARLLLLSVSLIGCKAADKSHATPTTVTPAADAAPTTPAILDAAPAPDAVAAAATPDDALIDGLLGGAAVGYSTTAQTAVYGSEVCEEGTGCGLTIYFEKGGKVDSVEIYEAGDEGDADALALILKAKRPAIAERIVGQGFLALDPTPWPRSSTPGAAAPDTLAMPTLGGTLRWRTYTLSLVGADGKAKVLHKSGPDKPHLPSPAWVYGAAGVPVLLLKLTWSPGAKYAEGFNQFDTVEVITLPPFDTAR